jgi:proliferating cell nuclear antigen
MSNNSLEFLAEVQWRLEIHICITMTVASEGQFEACPKGIEFRSKSCDAFIDIAIPSAILQQFYCPILLKFGLRIAEFSKIIKRVDNNFPIEIFIQDRSIVIATIGAFFCYKSNLIESSHVSPVIE